MTQMQNVLSSICIICEICLSLLALTGCASANPALYPPSSIDAQPIYLLDNHWHTALILRSDSLPTDLRNRLGTAAAGRWVVIGWGDEGFFRAPKITVPLALQALFYSRGSVMQVFPLDDPPNSFPRNVSVYRPTLSSAGLRRVIDSVDSAFVRRAGDLVDAGPGPNGGRFFEARGRYSLLHTCNQWTAERLHDGGMPITAAYAGLASNFEWQLQRPEITGVVEFRGVGQSINPMGE